MAAGSPASRSAGPARIDPISSHRPPTVTGMAELLELADRFGPVEVDIDAGCVACGTVVEGVVVVPDDSESVICADCGLPVVA